MKSSNLTEHVRSKEEAPATSNPSTLENTNLHPPTELPRRVDDEFSDMLKTAYLGDDKVNPDIKTPNVDEDPLNESESVELENEDNPEISCLPINVRQLVSLTDDPKLLTITFRYFVLSIFFTIPGAFLAQMSQFRTRQAPYPVFFVLIACHYAGHFLAAVLPAKTIKIPFTKYSFSLNPGPWSIKEHVLVTLTAASGATSNMAFTPLAVGAIFYGQNAHPAAALAFMFAIVWLGLAFAAGCRNLLLYEPANIWPQALMETTLFETFRKTDLNSKVARRQMKVFFLALIGMTLWEFMPEYVFPFTSSLAFLCWVAPENPVANFIGSGLGGMGFLNLSLDWSNINWNGSNILLTPFWTQMVLFCAFAFNCWVLLPWAKWGNLTPYKEGLMSNKLLLKNGSAYPVPAIVTKNFQLNQTAYQEYGPIYWGAQYIWSEFFSFAVLPSSLVWIALFAWKPLKLAVTRLKARIAQRGKISVHDQHQDRLNILAKSYPEVPVWWFIALFVVSMVMLIIVTACGQMWIPLWSIFVAVPTAFITVIPLAWLYSNSNYLVVIGGLHEMIYGALSETQAGMNYRNPCGMTSYASVASDPWYRAQIMLQDQKIGHYMHIPPKAVFFSQMFGTIIGVPINYAVIRWVVTAKYDYLAGITPDPIHQWTGQRLQAANSLGVMYTIIGPSNFFNMSLFRPLPYGFLVGLGAPFFIYALHRAFPRARFDLWNTTIFFGGLAQFYGNVSTGYTSAIIGAFVAMYWAYRHHFELWKRYSYMIAAAFDAGFNFAMLLIFLFFGAAKTITMPNWWGNDADSVERCFALNPTKK